MSSARAESPGRIAREQAHGARVDAGNPGSAIRTALPGRVALRRIRDYPRQLLSLGIFFGLCAIVSPLCGLVRTLGGSRLSSAFGQRLIGRLARCWLGFSRLIGAIEVDFPDAGGLRDQRGTIFAANHPSLVDAVVLLAVAPRAACMVRADLIRSPFVGGFARLCGHVTNDSGPALIREGIGKLASGDNLLIFPEGTRTRRGRPVNSFKSGFALIAVKSGAPIQTILIESGGEYLSKGISLFAPTLLPWRMTVRLGEVVHAQPGESAQALAARLERDFQSRIAPRGSGLF